jgi:RNA polymerase sigma-32 factor
MAGLTFEQEAELARRWQTRRDREAADTLARAHQRLVMTQARKHRSAGLPLADLIGEGNLGIMLALEKFEPERGVPFEAYAAHWVRARIVGGVLRARGICAGRGPFRPGVFFRLTRERARVACQHGTSEDANRILAERLELPLELLNEALAHLDMKVLSFDALWPESAAPELLTVAADQEQELSRRQAVRHLQQCVSHAMTVLDARERLIAERRLMADPQDQPSLADLARQLGVSRERVGQLEARTKRKLRESFAKIGILPQPNRQP